ncbi:MAG: imidazolonepropionase [Planctomycetota bacterium]
MHRLLIRGARLLTLGGQGPAQRGKDLSDLGVVPSADVLVEGSRIAQVQPHSASPPSPTDADVEVWDADGRVLMPAFVDCHTHACWAGDRLDEWELKQQGVPYLELLKRGGGIMSTVRSVRTATQQQLADDLLGRLNRMLRLGTTCVEVKSGYGLSTADELKMLRAIADAANRWSGRLRLTACLGHALDPDVARDRFVKQTIEETLPAVSTEFPDATVDAYCEEGAWSVDECLRLFERAQTLGHSIRVHADQFHDLGLIPAAVAREFNSVDHLEASSATHLAELAHSEVFGVMLPCSGFQVDGRYADGRAFVDAGGKLALATNFNPGSAPCGSVPMALALAVRHLGITTAEAITAVTRNAADLLQLKAGAVAEGMPADLVLLDHYDERQLAYEFGGNPVAAVICGGQLVTAWRGSAA